MASLLPQPVGFMRMRSRLYLSLFRCSQCCLRIVYSVFRRTACVLTWVCRWFVQFDSCRACDFAHKDFASSNASLTRRNGRFKQPRWSYLFSIRWLINLIQYILSQKGAARLCRRTSGILIAQLERITSAPNLKWTRCFKLYFLRHLRQSCIFAFYKVVQHHVECLYRANGEYSMGLLGL